MTEIHPMVKFSSTEMTFKGGVFSRKIIYNYTLQKLAKTLDK